MEGIPAGEPSVCGAGETLADADEVWVMIGTVVLVAALQTATPSPAPPRATVKSVTQPLVVLECRLVDTSLRPSNLLLESRGARGFLKDGKVSRTQPRFVVIADQHNVLRGVDALFDNRVFGTYSGQWEDRTISAETQTSGTFVSVQFRLADGERYHAEVTEIAPPWGSARPLITHSGFCSAQSVSQSPLTADEVQRLETQ